MKEKWLVILSGKEFYLRELLKLRSSPRIEMLKIDDIYYLTSADFEKCIEAKKVENLGKDLIKTLNGIYQLRFPDWENIMFGGVNWIDKNGNKTIFLSGEIKSGIRLSGTLTVIGNDGQVNSNYHKNLIESDIFELSNTNPNVKKALGIYSSREHSWSNLYIIYEIIDGDVGGKSIIVSNGWASGKKIEKFHNTANTSNSVGDEARHHNPQRLAPPRPMTIEEARKFISDLLNKWIETKIQKIR